MSEYRPATIWYASDRRALSSLKVWVYDDAGVMAIGNGVLRFAGKKGTMLEIERIESVDLAAQNSNWPVYAFGVFVMIELSSFRGIPIFISAPLIFVTVFVGIQFGKATKWVRVAHRDGRGELTTTWFADGTALGWAPILRGSSKLYELIHRHSLKSERIQGSSDNPDNWIILGLRLGAEEREQAKCPWCQATVVANADGICPACDRRI